VFTAKRETIRAYTIVRGGSPEPEIIPFEPDLDHASGGKRKTDVVHVWPSSFGKAAFFVIFL
jgi:hypothetical protein